MILQTRDSVASWLCEWDPLKQKALPRTTCKKYLLLDYNLFSRLESLESLSELLFCCWNLCCKYVRHVIMMIKYMTCQNVSAFFLIFFFYTDMHVTMLFGHEHLPIMNHDLIYRPLVFRTPIIHAKSGSVLFVIFEIWNPNITYTIYLFIYIFLSLLA